MKLTTRQIGRLGMTAIAGAAVASALVHGPTAEATPLGYLQAINDLGFNVEDATMALATGYEICEQLEDTEPDVIGRAMHEEHPAVFATDETGTAIVMAAQVQLCDQEFIDG